MAYSLDFTSCIFTIADNDGNLIKEYDLPNVEVFFDDQYITCRDIDTEWSLHISELADVDSGAYATFDDMRDVIVAQKVACVSSGGGTETTTTMGALINSATTATPNNTDYVATAESGGVLKKISWTNVKVFLKTYFDTIYTTTSAVASQITTAISGKLDANAPITGATKTKITYDSDGLVTSGADATTADISDSTNKRYVTDAELVVIGNTSGTNSGNETTSTIGSLLNGSGSATPNDTDLVATAESSVLKKITWTNVKAFLKTYFDSLYSRVLYKSTTDGTNVTGTLSETLTTSQKIDANRVSSGSTIRVTSANKFTGTAGTKQCKIYINTSASLSGATLLGTSNNAASATRYLTMDRKLYVKASNNTEVPNPSLASYTDIGAFSSAFSNINIDWTIDQYIIFSITLGNTGDSGLNSSYIIEYL